MMDVWQHRSHLKKIAVALLSIMIMLSLVQPVPTAYGESSSKLNLKKYGAPEKLLEPLGGATSIYDGATGIEDGTNVMYTTVKGQPALFQVIDMDNNKLLRSFPLTGMGESWHHEVAPDGTVYIATSWTLWAYSPVTKELTIAANFPGQGLWSLDVDSEGNVYTGTYPGGQVFKFDPITKETRDYGRMIGVIDQEYVRSIAYHDGFIYAGTAHDKIMKVDAATGEKEDIAAPLGDTGFVYDLTVVDDKYLFARYSVSKKMYIYDLDNQVWQSQILNNVNGLHVTDSLDGKVYIIADNKLKSYDPYQQVLEETAITYSSGLRGADWVEMKGDPDLPGKSLVTISFGGSIVFFNIETGQSKVYPSVVHPPAAVIYIIEKDSNGKLYMSTLGGGTGALYDPSTGMNSTLKLGQADSMEFLNNKMYMGVYPTANLFEYDVNQAPGDENPKFILQLGNDQDRITEMAAGDGKLFMGTISDYGKLGGALSIYDPAGGADGLQVYRNVVHNQSVVGLTYLDGKVFGSTNINNGLGSSPTEEEAKMFVFDVATGEKLSEFTPEIEGVENPVFIGKLAAGPDHLIWGAVNDRIFAMDPDTLQIVKSKQVFTGDYNFGAWSAVPMQFSEDGLLYALFGTQMLVIDPETLEHRNIVQAHYFEIGNDGHLYYSNRDQKTQLDRIKVEDLDGPEVPVEPGPSSVINGSFEEPLSANGEIPGWSSMFGTAETHFFEVSEERSYSGSKSLKVTDTVRNAAVAVQSDPIPVIPGESYTAETMMYVQEGTPSLLFRMFDESDKQVAEGLVHISSGLGEWQKVTTSAVAPANAKYARVFASSSGYSLSSVYYDDFNLIGKFPGEAKSAGVLNLQVPVEVKGGTIFNIPLQVKEASDLYAVDALVRYDANLFEVQSVTASESFTRGEEVFFQADYRTPGEIRIIASLLGDRKHDGEVEIADIHLKAKSLNKEAQTTFTLDKQSMTAKQDADQTGITYPLEQDQVQSVKITVTWAKEDVDRNGTVDWKDLLFVISQIGRQINDYNRPADVNGDGRINLIDASLVAKKLLIPMSEVRRLIN